MTVTGLFASKEVAAGKVQGKPRRAATLELTVILAAPCIDQCTAGNAECVLDSVRICSRQGACALWGPPTPCPDDSPYCIDGACVDTCVDTCPEKEARRCVEIGYQVCVERDDEPCLYWGPVISCGPQFTSPKRSHQA